MLDNIGDYFLDVTFITVSESKMHVLKEEKIEHGTTCTFSVTCTEIFQGYAMANCRPQRKSDIFLQQEWQHSKECIYVSKGNIISVVRLPRKCDFQTDTQMEGQTDTGRDPYVPLICFAGNTKC